MSLFTLEDQLRASIDLVAFRKAKELLENGRAAALLVAKVAKPHTGEVVLGTAFTVEVVKAFAHLAGTESNTQLLTNGESIEWAKTNVGGVTISIQGRNA